ncbi:NAD(P)-dependent oxidoreductase [Lysinibacillus agricola]|uniref:NAD(P)-dependent oxidoreductase n=1 Tax=Lysinibacillus agricola TaxID=2590012 RepID=A0ABX7AW06_9BACI|nr:MULTISPECIES: NAD(P)-binding domain-containing protein [Lysinibacillus]KOS62961.1 3-hydroxyisobutyrate dehydrogenase [Lysinibacillus sp. FJAT-14222]QQP13931.1 NAD(P)-dependent oxidoreductase [Lysinibacillus agricola]
MSNVSVIGLGSMGAALARVLLQSGHQVTVWNRSIARAEPLIEDGAMLASSIDKAISASKVSIICVSDYKASYSILDTEEVKAAIKGKVLVQLSTGSPQQARDNEKWAKDNNVDYLDGAIASSPLQMGKMESTIFTSGSITAFQQSEPFLKSLAGNIPYLGEQVSAASSTELAFLSYLFGSYIGFFHAARILESDGLRVDSFGSMIENVSQVVGEVIKYESEVVQTESYDNAQSSINMCMTTVELFMEQAREAGINNEFPNFAHGLFKKALDAGYGNEELGALIKVMRK